MPSIRASENQADQKPAWSEQFKGDDVLPTSQDLPLARRLCSGSASFLSDN